MQQPYAAPTAAPASFSATAKRPVGVGLDAAPIATVKRRTTSPKDTSGKSEDCCAKAAIENCAATNAAAQRTILASLMANLSNAPPKPAQPKLSI